MALYRFLYRRLNCVAVFLIAATLWIFYLIVSAPIATDKKYDNMVLPHNDDFKAINKNIASVTRQMMTVVHEGQNKLPPQPPDLDPSDVGEKTENKPAIPPPPRVDDNQIDVKQNDKPINEDANKKVSSDKSKAGIDGDKPQDAVKTVGSNLSKNGTKVTEKSHNKTDGPVLIEMEKKVIQLGEKFKNKTMGDWETMKNKTLEKLTDLGVIQKPKYIKLIYAPVIWNLTLSMESIGNIMKETEFLKKKQNLTEMAYYPLLAPNSTGIINVTSSKYGLGYCDCMDLSCSCCVRMMNKWMTLNSTACSTVTFSSKSQELNFDFSVDKKSMFSRKIAAEFPPKICLESMSKVAGTCVLFSNVTSKVNVASEDHKIHLSGCMEYDLTLYNKTVSTFPVGCFQIPGRHKETEEVNQQNLGNFVP